MIAVAEIRTTFSLAPTPSAVRTSGTLGTDEFWTLIRIAAENSLLWRTNCGEILQNFFESASLYGWEKIVMKSYQRGMRILTAAAYCPAWVLIAAISSGPVLAEVGDERPIAPAASAPVGDPVFPSAIDPKYAGETSAKARLHTCIDQYNRNKAANANGELKWIERGGGYYSKCNTRLGGVAPSPAPLREGGDRSLGSEAPAGDRIMARGVTYTIQKFRSTEANAVDESVECLYRNQERLLCPTTDWIRFDKHYRTKDFDLLVIFTGNFGSGNRWHDWKLIIEDGKQVLIKPLAENCLACDIGADKLYFQSNEVVFTHRQEKQLHTATFRAGQFTSRVRKLDHREPLDEDTCGDLLGRYEYCKKAEPNTVDCSMASANSSHFSLLRIEDQYAGISYEGMQQMCRAACSGGKGMDRKTFLEKVCRR
ncbi:hypothetical protein [Bradyrhizobium ottawaense]|uniref:hypothetical protein n=1 Tax=Bradyrhizobium ottawaense TaxID=931866 RepID=UPI003FA0A937